jgi:hypothetical protein
MRSPTFLPEILYPFRDDCNGAELDAEKILFDAFPKAEELRISGTRNSELFDATQCQSLDESEA